MRKYHRLGGSDDRRLLLSLGGWEVQGLGSLWLLAGVSSWLVGGPLLTVSSHGREIFGVSPPFMRTAVLSDQGSILRTSFNHNPLLEGPFSNAVPWGLGLQLTNLWGDIIHPIIITNAVLPWRLPSLSSSFTPKT